jgi:hypothetical protein
VLSPPDVDGGGAAVPDALDVDDVVDEVEVVEEIEVEEEVAVVVPPWIRNPGLGNPFTLSVSIMNRRTYCWLTASALPGIDVFHRYLPALVKLMPADERSMVSTREVVWRNGAYW